MHSKLTIKTQINNSWYIYSQLGTNEHIKPLFLLPTVHTHSCLLTGKLNVSREIRSSNGPRVNTRGLPHLAIVAEERNSDNFFNKNRNKMYSTPLIPFCFSVRQFHGQILDGNYLLKISKWGIFKVNIKDTSSLRRRH